MLLGFAAFGRVIAWLVHGAALAWDMIVVEIAVVALLFVASRACSAADLNSSAGDS
mgnify:CR=1 FL=1